MWRVGGSNIKLNVLEKILLELKPNSPELAAEINEKESKINGTDAKILFYNTSFIKVVTASDSARGNRATLLLLDEFRLISKDVIDTILRKFLTQRRMPNYNALSREEKKAEYAKEKNKIMYLSSAYFSDHWSYEKCIDTFKAMMSDQKRQFVCGLPYQLSIAEGLLDPDIVEDEMSESNFSEIKMSMELNIAPLHSNVFENNLLNCWEVLKTHAPQRKDAICLIVTVTKAEKSMCIA